MGFSFWNLMSPFWAMPNNILGVFGLDLTLNFWGSLFSGNLGRFFSYGAYTGSRQGTFAFRRDGVLTNPDRAWTYQHILWAAERHLEELQVGRVIDPRGEFRPGLYGTILRATPGGRAMLLSGSAGLVGNNLLDWTRAGGVGEAAFPGSNIARFPCGGLHLDQTQVNVRSEQDCALAELEPAGPFATGRLSERVRTIAPHTGLGLSANTLVALIDGENRAAILNAEVVEEVDGRTQLWLASDPPDLSRDRLRLRNLNTPPAPNVEDVPRLTQARYVNLAATSAPAGARPDYDRADIVRFSDPGTGNPIGAGMIQSFEASLTLDADLPAGLQRPISLRRATPGAGGNVNLTDQDRVLDFTGGIAPVRNEAILVTRGSDSIAVVVVEAPADPADLHRTVDRSLSPLGGSAGETVSWVRLVGAADDLNARDGRFDIEPAGTVTYAARDERRAPAVNDHVALEDAAGQVVARRVMTLNYDALVFQHEVPAPNVRMERFTPGAVDERDVSIQRFLTVALDAAQDLSGQALHLIELNARPPLAAGATPALQFTALNDATATNVTGALGGAPVPSQFVVLSQVGSSPLGAVTRRVRVRFTLDRDIGLDGVDVEMILLDAAGPAYDAQVIDAATVTVLPRVGALDVQLPRFRAGNLIRATGGPANPLYRLDGVERHGATLRLAGGPALAMPTPAPFTVQLLDIRNPNTGTSRLGVRGRAQRVGGVTQIAIDVWRPDAVNNADVVGIIAGGVTHPAQVAGAPVVDLIEFTAAPDVTLGPTGLVDVTIPPVANTAFSSSFRLESNRRVVVIDDNPPPLAATDNLVVLIPFRLLPDDRSVTANGWLSAGTTLVPEDPENWELERKQSLIDHELRHTEQSLMWGPWLLTWFPLLAFQIPVELATDVELPRYSAYVDAAIEEEPRGLFLNIPDFHGVDFQADNVVQISQTLSGSPVNATLGPAEGEQGFRLIASSQLSVGAVLIQKQGERRHVAGVVRSTGGNQVLDIPDAQGVTFAAGDAVELRKVGPAQTVTLNGRSEQRFGLAANSALPRGAVRVRRMQSGAGSHWDTFFDVMQFTTAGGVMNFLGGTVWGGLFWLVGKLFYWMGRKIFTSDPSQAAAVIENGSAVQFGGEVVPEALRGAQRVTIRSGDESIVVRSVNGVTENRLTLSSAISFTGTVQVAPYSTRNVADEWDWHSYYPARVPDATKPNAIRVEDAGGDALRLNVFDRVLVTAENRSVRTRVTAVGADGTVELEDEPPTSGDERTLRVAFLAVTDPVGETDSVMLQLTGMDWMRYLFDPYGQISYRLAPQRDTFWGVVARIARYAFGMQSWSLVFPGWYIWDNLFKQIDDDGHLSQMEQDASEESGDLYSPLSRLRPGPDSLPFVGDIARFWFFPWDSNYATWRRDMSVLRTMRRDAPGMAYANAYRPRLLPSFATTGAANDPNGAAEAPAGSGTLMPDLLVRRNAATLNEPTETNPRSFVPSDRAWLPSSPKLERALGAYVGFTQPGTHRVSVPNDIVGATNAREAQEGGQSFLFSTGQTIFYDIPVEDVTVDIGGQRVGNGGMATLVQTQRAAVIVTPNETRRYVVSLLRPETGAVLRANGDRTIVAQTSNSEEPVEIARFYEFAPDASPAACSRRGSFNSNVLNVHGVHVPTDLYIPVRTCRVRVVNTLAARSAIPSGDDVRGDVNALSITQARPGDQVFVLVPTAILSPLRLDAVTYPSHPPNALNPAPDIDAETTPDGLRNFIGVDGGIFRIAFSADDPPEEQADLSFRVDVGATRNSATLETALQLLPHFRLTAGNLQVARGSTIVLQCSDGVNAGTAVVTPSEGAQVTVTGSDVRIDVEAGAAAGLRRVLVTDAANADHRARRTIEVV